MDSSVVADKSRGAIRFNKIPYIYSESGESLYETEKSRSATPRNIESGEGGRDGLRRKPWSVSVFAVLSPYIFRVNNTRSKSRIPAREAHRRGK